MILTSRILVQYFKVLEPLKEACIQHIPHKYMAEMSQKSKKVINYYSILHSFCSRDTRNALGQIYGYRPLNHNALFIFYNEGV